MSAEHIHFQDEAEYSWTIVEMRLAKAPRTPDESLAKWDQRYKVERYYSMDKVKKNLVMFFNIPPPSFKPPPSLSMPPPPAPRHLRTKADKSAKKASSDKASPRRSQRLAFKYSSS